METLADHKSMPPGGQKQSLARDISRYRVPVSRTSLQCPPDHSPYFLLYTTEQLQHRDPSCTEVVSRRKPASRQEERILQLRSNIERLTYRLHEAGDDLKKAATALKRKIRQADNHAQMLEHTSDYLQKVSTANREGASLIVFNALRLMQQYPGKQIDEICLGTQGKWQAVSAGFWRKSRYESQVLSADCTASQSGGTRPKH